MAPSGRLACGDRPEVGARGWDKARAPITRRSNPPESVSGSLTVLALFGQRPDWPCRTAPSGSSGPSRPTSARPPPDGVGRTAPARTFWITDIFARANSIALFAQAVWARVPPAQGKARCLPPTSPFGHPRRPAEDRGGTDASDVCGPGAPLQLYRRNRAICHRGERGIGPVMGRARLPPVAGSVCRPFVFPAAICSNEHSRLNPVN